MHVAFGRRFTLAFAIMVLCSNIARAETATCPPQKEAISFPGADGTILRGELLSPCGSSATQTLPLTMLINPFGQSYITYNAQAQAFARAGFRTLRYNTRGWHSSGGAITLDYDLLAKDAQKALDWATEHYATSRIGVAGISEGGGVALLLAAADPRLSAVGVLSGWTDMLHSSMGATPRMTWGVILAGIVFAAGNPIDLVKDLAKKARDNPPFDPHAMMRAISPWYRLDAINAHKPAIFMSHALDDTLFPSNQIVDFYHRLSGDKHLQINRGFHAGPEILSLPNPDATTWRALRQWFRDYLINDDGSDLNGTIQVAYKNRDQLLSLNDHAWRDADNETHYLIQSDRGHELSAIAQASIEDDGLKVTQLARDRSGIHTGTPLLSAFFNMRNLKTIKVPVTKIRRPYALAFVGPQRDHATTIYGSPKLTLHVNSEAKRGMIVAHLVDLADGQDHGELITHGVYTWSSSDRQPTGEIKLQFDFYATAWRLEAGHRLALVLNSSDIEYLPPTVLPYNYSMLANPGAQILSFSSRPDGDSQVLVSEGNTADYQ